VTTDAIISLSPVSCALFHLTDVIIYYMLCAITLRELVCLLLRLVSPEILLNGWLYHLSVCECFVLCVNVFVHLCGVCVRERRLSALHVLFCVCVCVYVSAC
jgi:hypothetical protein